jgi:hypothetical protein
MARGWRRQKQQRAAQAEARSGRGSLPGKVAAAGSRKTPAPSTAHAGNRRRAPRVKARSAAAV